MATQLKHLKLGSMVVLETDLQGEATRLEGLITQLSNSISQSLTSYYQKSETYNQTEINNMISSIPKFKVTVATAKSASDLTPDVETPATDIVYLVAAKNTSGSTAKDVYVEWIFVKPQTYTAIESPTGTISGTVYELVNGVYAPTTDTEYKSGKTYYSMTEGEGDWEQLGTQDLDLSGYVRFNQVIKTAGFASAAADDVNPVTAKAVYDAIAAHVANITSDATIALTTEADGKTKKIAVAYNTTRMTVDGDGKLDVSLDSTLSNDQSQKAASAGAVVTALAGKADKLGTLTDETEVSDILTALGGTLPAEEEEGSGE